MLEKILASFLAVVAVPAICAADTMQNEFDRLEGVMRADIMKRDLRQCWEETSRTVIRINGCADLRFTFVKTVEACEIYGFVWRKNPLKLDEAEKLQAEIDAFKVESVEWLRQLTARNLNAAGCPSKPPS